MLVFEKIDINGDMRLDKDEFMLLLKEWNTQVDDEEANGAFEHFAAGEDAITLAKFQAALLKFSLGNEIDSARKY